jgi:hypothetical protein
MKLKTQLLLAIFLITIWQGKSYGQQMLDLDKTLLIKISPLSFLEPETIVIQGGVEYFFTPKISLQTELGFNGGVVGIPSGRGKNEDFSLWRSKSEIKFHAKKFYVGLELFFVQKDFIRSDDSYSGSNVTTWYDTARINFQVYGTGLKFGRQHFVSDNILLDSFFGIGIRFRNRSVQVIELAENQKPDFFDGSFLEGDRYSFEGWDSLPHFTIGIKVGILTGTRD